MSDSPVPHDRAERGRNAVGAFREVGAAELAAMWAETDARAAGASAADIESFTAEALGAAGCEEFLDALRLLSWRARGLSQGLDIVNIGGPRGAEDAMMHLLVVTAAALADLVTAAFTIRDPTAEDTARDEAAESWRDAIKKLSRLTGNEPIEQAPIPQGRREKNSLPS